MSVIFKFKLLLEKHALMVSYLTIEPPQVSPYLLAKKQQCTYVGLFLRPLSLILVYNDQSPDFYFDLIQRIQCKKAINPNLNHYLYVINKISSPDANLQFFQLANLSNLFPLFIGMLILALLTDSLSYQPTNDEKNIILS